MIREVLGLERSELTLEAVSSALGLGGDEPMVESETLDFKRQLNKSDFDIAKDVTAFANRSGGLLIYGVTEDRKGNPVAIEPFDVDEVKVQDYLRKTVWRCTAPPVPNVEAIRVLGVDGLGLMIVVVPASSMAPHGVAVSGDAYVSFFQRDGANCQPMRESDIERQYRARWNWREALEQRFVELEKRFTPHPDGVSAVQLCAVPLSGGLLYADRRAGRDRFRRLQQRENLSLILGEETRMRFGRLTGLSNEVADVDAEPGMYYGERSSLGQRGEASLWGFLDSYQHPGGTRQTPPGVALRELHEANSSASRNNLVVLFLHLTLALRDIYNEFGATGDVVMRFAFKLQSQVVWTVGVSPRRAARGFLDEKMMEEHVMSVTELSDSRSVVRLVDELLASFACGFDAACPRIADDDGLLLRSTVRSEAAYWEGRSIELTSEGQRD